MDEVLLVVNHYAFLGGDRHLPGVVGQIQEPNGFFDVVVVPEQSAGVDFEFDIGNLEGLEGKHLEELVRYEAKPILRQPQVLYEGLVNKLNTPKG